MSQINPHPLESKMTQEQIDTLMKMETPTEMSAYMHELELSSGLRVRDELNASRLHEVVQEEQAAPKYSIKIGDETFTADTTEELAAKSEAALVARVQKTQADAAAADSARTKDGRFAKQPSVTDGADQIASDVVIRALEAQGIDPDALRDASENKKYERSWASATNEFLKSTPDYPGGEELQQRMAARLLDLGLTDQPSAESLRAAYDSISAEAEQYLALQKATTSEEIQQIIGKTQRDNDARRYHR
jgi:hypothetical protein